MKYPKCKENLSAIKKSVVRDLEALRTEILEHVPKSSVSISTVHPVNFKVFFSNLCATHQKVTKHNCESHFSESYLRSQNELYLTSIQDINEDVKNTNKELGFATFDIYGAISGKEDKYLSDGLNLSLKSFPILISDLKTTVDSLNNKQMNSQPKLPVHLRLGAKATNRLDYSSKTGEEKDGEQHSASSEVSSGKFAPYEDQRPTSKMGEDPDAIDECDEYEYNGEYVPEDQYPDDDEYYAKEYPDDDGYFDDRDFYNGYDRGKKQHHEELDLREAKYFNNEFDEGRYSNEGKYFESRHQNRSGFGKHSAHSWEEERKASNLPDARTMIRSENSFRKRSPSFESDRHSSQSGYSQRFRNPSPPRKHYSEDKFTMREMPSKRHNFYNERKNSPPDRYSRPSFSKDTRNYSPPARRPSYNTSSGPSGPRSRSRDWSPPFKSRQHNDKTQVTL